MKPFRWHGYDILHQHVFNYVFFSCWKGDDKANNREIRKHRLLIDWEKPLNQEELAWLCGRED